MSIARKIKRALRGRVGARAALLETGRRSRAALVRRRERALLTRRKSTDGDVAARLRPELAGKSAAWLLDHFRTREDPKFFSGFDIDVSARLPHEHFAVATARLLERAREIVEAHRWPLLGYGVRDFGAEIDWLRDPVSGARWPLLYHADITLLRGDGSDVRVVWELNRLAHLITLGRAYAITGEERFAEEVFTQIESWRAQNPTGRGPNWACAMEVALRAMNLLAAFELVRRAPQLNEERLQALLGMLDEHGAHIRRHLEFSYIATGNHYLSDIVGLLWLGLMLPELRVAHAWRAWALREVLSEMDKQTLDDGADTEASTGYHRFVLELFLYSFILCRANRVEIPERYWRKLYAMLDYVRAYLRPDGRAPLIGDTDSGQVLPSTRRAANDHAYVLAIGAAVFNEPRFKAGHETPPEELWWMLGPDGLAAYEKLRREEVAASSIAFKDAGTYVMREGDLYLLFNASGAGLDGRGAHGHNDALSIEVSACGRAFLTDPGTYLYTADLRERRLFRSTAYHSTVEVDDTEQNTTDPSQPFVIGDEAHPHVLRWETSRERDFVLAEHSGYRRLSAPITHRRAARFDKRERYWLIEDALLGSGEHTFRFRFHADAGLETRARPDAIIEVCDKMTGARLLIASVIGLKMSPTFEPCWTSQDYGAKEASQSVCWTIRAPAPLVAAWALVPVCAGEDEGPRVELIARLREEYP